MHGKLAARIARALRHVIALQPIVDAHSGIAAAGLPRLFRGPADYDLAWGGLRALQGGAHGLMELAARFEDHEHGLAGVRHLRERRLEQPQRNAADFVAEDDVVAAQHVAGIHRARLQQDGGRGAEV